MKIKVAKPFKDETAYVFDIEVALPDGSTKAGVIGFTRTLAREVGDDNINVNAIAPGSTLSEDDPSAEVLKMRGARVGDRCLKRVQLPKDLVGTMLFLASPLSDFMTGQTVAVDGGAAFL